MEDVKTKDYIFLKSGSNRQKVILDDILYAEAMRNWCRIYTGDSCIVTKSTMKQLLSVLGDGFMQVHKSYIVPLQKIESVKGRKIKIAGTDVPVGRLFWVSFLAAINNQEHK